MGYDELFLDEPITAQHQHQHQYYENGDHHYTTEYFDRNVGWVIRRNFENDRIRIPFYRSSYIPLKRIKNAITGKYYNYLVGSKNEQLLFKVALCTAEPGTYIESPNPHNTIIDPCILFFESPEEYEQYFFTPVSNDIKTKWRNKQILLLSAPDRQ